MEQGGKQHLLVRQMYSWPFLVLCMSIDIEDTIPIRMRRHRVLKPKISCSKHGTIKITRGKALRAISLENGTIIDVGFRANVPHPFPEGNHGCKASNLIIRRVKGGSMTSNIACIVARGRATEPLEMVSPSKLARTAPWDWRIRSTTTGLGTLTHGQVNVRIYEL